MGCGLLGRRASLFGHKRDLREHAITNYSIRAYVCVRNKDVCVGYVVATLQVCCGCLAVLAFKDGGDATSARFAPVVPNVFKPRTRPTGKRLCSTLNKPNVERRNAES